MHVHELKTYAHEFEAIWEGRKTADLRKDDRAFRVDDILILLESDHDGRRVGDRFLVCKVRHYYRIAQLEGLPIGWAMLSIEVLDRGR